MKEDIKKEEQQKAKMRQIIIETNGNDVTIVKAEVAGTLELRGILQTILNNLK